VQDVIQLKEFVLLNCQSEIDALEHFWYNSQSCYGTLDQEILLDSRELRKIIEKDFKMEQEFEMDKQEKQSLHLEVKSPK